MNKVHVTARLLSPVAIKRNRHSERSESARSISGTQVRGALANLYLQHHGQTDDVFNDLFLNEMACRFGPLNPGPEPFPLTAASCKRQGIQHALSDRLWFRIAQHYLAGRDLGDKDTPWRHCCHCEADLKDLEGFWSWKGDHLDEAPDLHPQVAAHVGIDRHTATAAEAIFYTLEALVPSGRDPDLQGWFMADDVALANLRELLQSENHRISVGHHRSRGYGDVQLCIGEADDAPLRTEEWEHWSAELVRKLRKEPFCIPDLDAREDFFFSLSLPTGAVLVDPFLRYTLDPADMIPWLPPMSQVEQAFPLTSRPVQQLDTGGAVRWIAAVTRHERLRGWNAAHGLPRQDEWMVTRGAVYVYHFRGLAAQREYLVKLLVDLAQEGVGLRRNEGFGLVSVSHDFHRCFHEQQEVKHGHFDH